MNDNKVSMNKYILNNKILSIVKRKNNTYTVKDGIINFIVNIDTMRCPCKTSLLCDHLIYILITVFKLNFKILEFFHKLIIQFHSNIKHPKLNKFLENILHTEILNDDCAICMNSMIYKENIDELSECCICQKYCHQKCAMKWAKTKKSNSNCAYCITGNMFEI